MRVGIAVVPAYTRTPAVLAATVATLSDICPGRFALGLGTSSETMLEGWHGLRLDRPVLRMHETISLLGSMLEGEKSQFEGATLSSVGYRQPALATRVPILLAALGPRMTHLAATASDGIVLNLVPLGVLESIVERIRAHAEAAGRSADSIEIAGRLPVLVTDEVAAGRDLFRRQFAPYYVNPVYNRFLESSGYPEEAAAILAAGGTGDWTGARAAMSDDLVDAVAVIGDAAYCQRRIRAFVEAGLTTPILGCPALEPGVHRDTYEALAPALCSTQHSAADRGATAGPVRRDDVPGGAGR